MAALQNTVQLSDGNIMPTMSLGTYFGTLKDIEENSEHIVDVIRTAIKVGYRHIDTAWLYGTEKMVGQAIRKCVEEGLVTRKEMFITTKLSFAHHEPEGVESILKESLSNLGMDYVDLYLFHGPFAIIKGDSNDFAVFNETTKFDPQNDHLKTWKALENCVKAGLCKSIGISNFNTSQTQHILDNCEIKPVNNQVESHPYLSQQELVDYCLSRGVTITAYTPLGQAHSSWIKDGFVSPLKNDVVLAIAETHGCSPAEVALRYQIQRGVCVTVKSSSEQRLKQNTQIFNFALSEDEMDKMRQLNKNDRINLFKPAMVHKDYPFHVKY